VTRLGQQHNALAVTRSVRAALDEVEGGVGDLAPAAVDGERVSAVLDLYDLGTNLATLFDPAGPLRSCYDLPGFDLGPRLDTFDSCGLSNRLDYIFISADLPPRFRGDSVLRSGLWGSRKTRPTAWDVYPDITTGTQQASDHSALSVRLNL
jgi:endonuclease/exonuclease/phosphatase family metal-dependent hydrolase